MRWGFVLAEETGYEADESLITEDNTTNLTADGDISCVTDGDTTGIDLSYVTAGKSSAEIIKII